MNKKVLFIIISGAVLGAGFVTLIILLLTGQNQSQREAQQARLEADSLKLAIQQDDLDRQYSDLQADFMQYEDQAVYLKNDSLVIQYNESKARIEELMRQLQQERKSHKSDNAASQRKIAQLEAEIGTLRGIVKHYLEEIQRLGKENEGLRNELASSQQQNQQLTQTVQQTSVQNQQLTQTVQLARKLTITNLRMTAYNKKDKVEKKINKAVRLGVSFTVTPNNTAAAGRKTFYVRILSPEGVLLGHGGNFTIDGKSVPCTQTKTEEYDNGELPVSIYWNAGGYTLTPGNYTVEVFADGYRLGTRSVPMKE